MLISQPVVMWTHKITWLGIFRMLQTLFPRVLVSGILTWAEYTACVQLRVHYGASSYALSMMFLVSALYLLSLYTYHKVIFVGAGSPGDFSLLRLAPNRAVTPYGCDSAGASFDSRNRNKTSNAEDGHVTRNVGADSDPGTDTGTDTGRQFGAGWTDESITPPHWLLSSHHIENNVISYRSCTTCQAWKPDRCHHCSVCRRCFLKMDHHCPWFACCIGFRNHKLFIQSLVYITLFCTAVLLVSFQMLYGFFVDGQYEDEYLSLSLVFLFVAALVFFISVGCFTAFSVYLMLRNTSTIEFQDTYWSSADRAYEYDDSGQRRKLGHMYDLGVAKNWTQTMGRRWYQWVFPVCVTSTAYDSFNNGLNFLVDEHVFQKHVHNAQLQNQLNSQLREYRDRIRGVA